MRSDTVLLAAALTIVRPVPGTDLAVEMVGMYSRTPLAPSAPPSR